MASRKSKPSKPEPARKADPERDELFETLRKLETEHVQTTALAPAPPLKLTCEELLRLEQLEREGTWRPWEMHGRDEPTAEQLAAGEPGSWRAEVKVAELMQAIERKNELLTEWMKERGIEDDEKVPEAIKIQIFRSAQFNTNIKGWRGSFFASMPFTSANLVKMLDGSKRFRSFAHNESVRQLELDAAADASLGKA